MRLYPHARECHLYVRASFNTPWPKYATRVRRTSRGSSARLRFHDNQEPSPFYLPPNAARHCDSPLARVLSCPVLYSSPVPSSRLLFSYSTQLTTDMAGQLLQRPRLLVMVVVLAIAATGTQGASYLETRFFSNANCTGTVERMLVQTMATCMPNGSGHYVYQACDVGNSTALTFHCDDAACSNCTFTAFEIDVCSGYYQTDTCVGDATVTPFGSVEDAIWRENYVTNYTDGCHTANRSSWQFNRIGYHYSQDAIMACNASAAWEQDCTSVNCTTYTTKVSSVGVCEDVRNGYQLSCKHTCLLTTTSGALAARTAWGLAARIAWAAALATAALLLHFGPI